MRLKSVPRLAEGTSATGESGAAIGSVYADGPLLQRTVIFTLSAKLKAAAANKL